MAPIKDHLLLCFSLLLAGVLVGCLPSSAPEDGQGSVFPIDSRILFRIAEQHNCPQGDCEPTVSLLMNTEKIYGCCNFAIRHAVHRDGSRIQVDLREIFRPSICLTALGPATAAEPLALPTGRYDLRFVLGRQIDEYELTVTDSALAVQEVAADTTEPLTLLTWRYPRRSFAYLCGTMSETSWICGAFLDSLLSTGRFVEFAFPDSGNVPYPLASGGHYYNMPARYFRYETEADYDTAGAILGRYARDVLAQQESAHLYLMNWRQKWYRSWVPEDWPGR